MSAEQKINEAMKILKDLGKKQQIEILEELTENIESDKATVTKNYPQANKGYLRCQMLIDEMIDKLKNQ